MTEAERDECPGWLYIEAEHEYVTERIISKEMKKNTKEQECPTVSVIMPCYNDGMYIEEAVDSLRIQSWPEIELVIIDDGSDDSETLETIEKLQFKRKKILHTEHVGPAAARNCGIAAAEGEYILPLDADDTIDAEYISRAVDVIRKKPETGIVYCHADLFGAASGLWELPDYSLRTELLDNCIFVTALFRKEDWKQAGGFCEDLKAGMEDYDFWLSLMEMGREVYQLPEVYFHYRIKKTSRTTRFQDNYANVQETYLRLYQRHRKLYQRYMDLYCTELRRNLIDQLMINRKLQAEKEEQNEKDVRQIRTDQDEMLQMSLREDPLVEYVVSIRRLKPRFGRFLEHVLNMKNAVKKKIGRS